MSVSEPSTDLKVSFELSLGKEYDITHLAELMVLPPSTCAITSETLFEGTDAYHHLIIVPKEIIFDQLIRSACSHWRKHDHEPYINNPNRRYGVYLGDKHPFFRFQWIDDKAGYTDITIFGLAVDDPVLLQFLEEHPRIKVFHDRGQETDQMLEYCAGYD